jgi:hypothetical protein
MIRINIHCATPILPTPPLLRCNTKGTVTSCQLRSARACGQRGCGVLSPQAEGHRPLYISLYTETGGLSCNAKSSEPKHCPIVNRLPRIHLDECLEDYSTYGLRKSSKLQKLYEEVYVGEVWVQERAALGVRFRCLPGVFQAGSEEWCAPQCETARVMARLGCYAASEQLVSVGGFVYDSNQSLHMISARPTLFADILFTLPFSPHRNICLGSVL